jgi:CheY-like chemotaxis protein/nitrogen-specific signal transduction histidine kinase
MKILSVDDKAENLYMLEALLRGHGYEVDSASDGMEALRLAHSGKYDLIVSDILMPRMDGFQLCRELKRDPRLGGVPFIFYTATYTDPRDAAFALSLGANRFLIKPMEPDQFVKALQETLAESASSQREVAVEEPEDEAIYLKEYNARLIAKLEKKMLDLESANRALREDIAERQRQTAEREKLERQLRQAQKLEAIGTLAGGIAHDFNNILGAIIGNAELGAEESEAGGLAHKLFTEISRAATRGRGLTQQIMAFSSQADPVREPVRIDAAITEAINLTRPLLPATVEVRTEVAAGTSTVFANPTQLHQIFANLLQNAGHAIGRERPGVISLKAANLHVDEDVAQLHPELSPGRYVHLSVGDNGAGMDEKTVDRIFDPFFTTRKFGEGTGLGLSVVHGIVKACDGTITVQSDPARGSTFHIYLPAHEADAAPATESARATAEGHGERVLLMDDDAAIARITGRSLERLGYQPTVFTEARAALAAFRKGAFDLVITDLTMLDATGIEVAREVWDQRPETPVVLITGYSATLDAAQARAMGFRDLLYKPFTSQELAACVRHALAAVEAT